MRTPTLTIMGVLSWAGALMLCHRPAAAQQSEIREVTDALSAIGVQINGLRGEYERAERLEVPRSLEARLAGAETFVLLGEFEKGALILKSLFDDPQMQKRPDYLAYLSLFAESQYQLGNYKQASEAFAQLARFEPERYALQSTRRVLQIAAVTHTFEHADELIKILRQRGDLPTEIAYMGALALLRQGRPADAIALGKEIPATHTLSAKARYLTAVALLETNALEAARQEFEALQAIDTFAYNSGNEVRDLSIMNTARLLLERDDEEAAINAYNLISDKSPRYHEALYELAWAYVRAAHASTEDNVRAANWQYALQTLDLYLTKEVKSADSAQARVLRANILLRSKRFDDAMENFGAVVDYYTPVRNRISALIADLESPEQFLEELINPSAKRAGMLPPAARRWASGKREIVDAAQVAVTLDQAELWLLQSRRMALEMITALSQERLVKSLEGPYALLLEVQNTLAEVATRLLDVERKAFSQSIDAGRAKMLEEVLTQRSLLEPEYRSLPRTRQEYETRLTQMRLTVARLEKQLAELSWPLNEQKNKLEETKTWVLENSETLSERELETQRQRLVQMEKSTQQQSLMLAALDSELQREKNAISILRAESERDANIRARYAETLARETEILAGANLSNTDRDLIAAVRTQRDILNARQRDLDDLKTVFVSLGHQRNEQAKEELTRLQEDIDASLDHVQRLRAEADQALAEVTIGSMEELESVFAQIVLQGDVGVVDVAWALKEAQTDKINAKVQEQRQQLERFDAEFRYLVENDDE